MFILFVFFVSYGVISNIVRNLSSLGMTRTAAFVFV